MSMAACRRQAHANSCDSWGCCRGAPPVTGWRRLYRWCPVQYWTPAQQQHRGELLTSMAVMPSDQMSAMVVYPSLLDSVTFGAIQ